jgi:hypothetical protein
MIYYKNLLISTILSAILLLAIVAIIIYTTKDKVLYPPIISDCPDYYNLNDAGKCINTGVWKNTESSCDIIDFSGNIYGAAGTDKTSGLCKKKLKAQDCKITWDGVTNNFSIC